MPCLRRSAGARANSVAHAAAGDQLRTRRADAIVAAGADGPTVAAAQAKLQSLGRSGRVPWRLPALRGLLAYVPTGDVLLVPVGHTLLRGVLRPLLIYALRTKLNMIPQGNQIIFGKAARRLARVRLS